SEILHPDDRDAVRRAISLALREDVIPHTTGRIRRKSDGAWRTIDMAGRFERDAPNRLPRRLTGVVADVTDRRPAAERQSLLIRELHHRVKNTL
ncbi:PAS domain-containing protein, partial [Methylobacterium sp. A54F]